MASRVYDTELWDRARAAALRRDASRCTVARLLGGPCRGRLHVHHLIPVSEGGDRYDVDNLGTACAAHHPQWEALRREVVRRLRGERPRCRHEHRSLDARLQCEARLARAAGRAA